MTNKPREFWIDDSNGYLYRNGIDSAKNEIHVIEYSAITELRAENEALKAQVDQLKIYLTNYQNDMIEKNKEIDELQEMVNFNAEIGKRIAAERDTLARQVEIAVKHLQEIRWSWENDAGRQCDNLAHEAIAQIQEMQGSSTTTKQYKETREWKRKF